MAAVDIQTRHDAAVEAVRDAVAHLQMIHRYGAHKLDQLDAEHLAVAIARLEGAVKTDLILEAA